MDFLTKTTTVSALLIGLMSWVFPGKLTAETEIFTVGTLEPVESAIPYLQYPGRARALRSLLFPPILSVQADGRVSCVICREAPEVQMRKDKKSQDSYVAVTLELKKDLHWGDGKDILAKDVKFTLETMAKSSYPKGEEPILPIARIILDKDQPRSLTLHLRHRRSDAFQLFTISLLPEHKKTEIAAALANPQTFLDLVTTDRSFAYGPFRIVDRKPNLWRLSPNDANPWDLQSRRDFDLRFFPNVDALADALGKTEIDQTLTDGLDWTAYSRIRERVPQIAKDYAVSAVPSSRTKVLLVNLHSPTLVNPQLRQALYLALDRKEFNKHIFDGLGEEAYGIFSSAMANRLGEKRPADFHPKLAADMLDKAGWTASKGGIRQSENQKFEITLACPKERSQGPWITTLAAKLQSLGISLQLEQPSEEEFAKILSHRRFRDLACVGWDLPPLSVPYSLFHSLGIPSRDNDYTGSNFSAWDQSIVDKILDTMMRETDLAHFAKLFGRLEKQFLNDLPAIPLLHEPLITLNRRQSLVKDADETEKDLASYPGSGDQAMRKRF